MYLMNIFQRLEKYECQQIAFSYTVLNLFVDITTKLESKKVLNLDLPMESNQVQ